MTHRGLCATEASGLLEKAQPSWSKYVLEYWGAREYDMRCSLMKTPNGDNLEFFYVLGYLEGMHRAYLIWKKTLTDPNNTDTIQKLVNSFIQLCVTSKEIYIMLHEGATERLEFARSNHTPITIYNQIPTEYYEGVCKALAYIAGKLDYALYSYKINTEHNDTLNWAMDYANSDGISRRRV